MVFVQVNAFSSSQIIMGAIIWSRAGRLFALFLGGIFFCLESLGSIWSWTFLCIYRSPPVLQPLRLSPTFWLMRIFKCVIKCFKLTQYRLSVSSSSPPTAFFNRSILALLPLQLLCVIPLFFEVKSALMLLLLVNWSGNFKVLFVCK